MQLKLTELEGKRHWVVVADDHEMYELLCSQIAWAAFQSGKMTDRHQIEIATVVTVERARAPGKEEEIGKINNDFIRIVLSEINRLGIKLP